MLGQLHRSHANTAGGGVHKHPLARADARKVCQRVIRGEENRGYRRCLRVGPPRGDARDPPVIHDDNGSRAEELTHHTVARREPEHIVGDLENDAGTFEADVVVRRVDPVRSGHHGSSHRCSADPAAPGRARGGAWIRATGAGQRSASPACRCRGWQAARCPPRQVQRRRFAQCAPAEGQSTRHHGARVAIRHGWPFRRPQHRRWPSRRRRPTRCAPGSRSVRSATIPTRRPGRDR